MSPLKSGNMSWGIGRCVLLLCSWSIVFVHAAPQASSRNSPDYSVTHLDIRDAILSLVSVLRDQMDKLERHEIRERQLGEQLTRSLATLEKRGRGEEKNIENIASYIARIDEKVKFAQATLDKQNEDSRLEGDRGRADLDQLKSLITQSTGGGSTLEKKLDLLTDKVNQLKLTGESNSAKFDSLMELWKATSLGGGHTGAGGGDLNDSIISELSEIKESLGRVLDSDKNRGGPGGGTDWQTEIVESLDSQRRQLAVLEEEIGRAIGLLGDVTKSATSMSGVLTSLDHDTKVGFSTMGSIFSSNSNSSSSPGSAGLGGTLTSIQDSLRSGQLSLEDRLTQTNSAIGDLTQKVETEYKQLSIELKGLANVESVLLDTGDSVLDTKRRLEYGVQQILGEINHQLSTYTGNLNTSLQQRFDGLATSVLGNQSIALTNLTARMEEEISQVWRQIGILYHQMSRSANLLDEIHSQTSQYVNNSMDTMSSMDGKVGQITSQMAGVDDNLNYLLGRMSLVVQEFNMIKGGLGDALVSLKESFAEIGELEGGTAAPALGVGDQGPGSGKGIEGGDDSRENEVNTL